MNPQDVQRKLSDLPVELFKDNPAPLSPPASPPLPAAAHPALPAPAVLPQPALPLLLMQSLLCSTACLVPTSKLCHQLRHSLAAAEERAVEDLLTEEIGGVAMAPQMAKVEGHERPEWPRWKVSNGGGALHA